MSALTGASAVAHPSASDLPSPSAARADLAPLDTVFRHADHRGYACARCHGDDSAHGLLLVRTRADCRACHHASPVAEPCVGCHEDDARSERLFTAARALSLPGGVSASRLLPFRHALHGGMECASCHGSPPEVSRSEVECASCHADHHRESADCSACHLKPPETAHPLAAHAGCAGAECHGEATFERPPRARSACLVCHADRGDHRPGDACADCHVLPPTSLPGLVGLAPPIGRR